MFNLYVTHRERIHFLARYGISGATGGIIKTLGLYVWVSVLGFEAEYLWGVVIAYCVALAVTFLMQKYWTFRDRSHAMLGHQVVFYTLVSLVNLGINALLLHLGKVSLESAGMDFFRGWYLLVQVLAVLISAMVAFFANYYITFREVRHDSETAF